VGRGEKDCCRLGRKWPRRFDAGSETEKMIRRAEHEERLKSEKAKRDLKISGNTTSAGAQGEAR